MNYIGFGTYLEWEILEHGLHRLKMLEFLDEKHGELVDRLVVARVLVLQQEIENFCRITDVPVVNVAKGIQTRKAESAMDFEVVFG